jgi:hypothetical protein
MDGLAEVRNSDGRENIARRKGCIARSSRPARPGPENQLHAFTQDLNLAVSRRIVLTGKVKLQPTSPGSP